MTPQPLLPRKLVPGLAVPTTDGAEFILSANPAEKFDLVVHKASNNCLLISSANGLNASFFSITSSKKVVGV